MCGAALLLTQLLDELRELPRLPTAVEADEGVERVGFGRLVYLRPHARQ